MYSIGGINFGNGVYNNGMINGAEVHIMQSSENADNVIESFEKAFRAGMDPNQVINQVLQQKNLNNSDFTELDIARINRKIEAIYNARNNNNKKGY